MNCNYLEARFLLICLCLSPCLETLSVLFPLWIHLCLASLACSPPSLPNYHPTPDSWSPRGRTLAPDYLTSKRCLPEVPITTCPPLPTPPAFAGTVISSGVSSWIQLLPGLSEHRSLPSFPPALTLPPSPVSAPPQLFWGPLGLYARAMVNFFPPYLATVHILHLLCVLLLNNNDQPWDYKQKSVLLTQLNSFPTRIPIILVQYPKGLQFIKLLAVLTKSCILDYTTVC